MRKFLQFILSTIVVLLCTFEMYAQQKTVTGKILDENNKPLVGVTINVKGTERGVVTNSSGSFSIRVSKGETLEITHVGYEAKRLS